MIQMDHKKALYFKNFCLIPGTYSYPATILLSLLMLIDRHGIFAKTRKSILLDFKRLDLWWGLF